MSAWEQLTTGRFSVIINQNTARSPAQIGRKGERIRNKMHFDSKHPEPEKRRGMKEADDLENNTTFEELVLEKVYPDGGYETELVDFYLVNPETLEVMDEHKSSW